jgi:hypothetical protein
MKVHAWITPSLLLLLFLAPSQAEDVSGKIKKAVERVTLDQPGTKPFHLKATLAPSFERDKDSGRTGSVEIWWMSPTRWRREVRSPEFHQIEVADGDHDWQKNEGDYFPEWLRQVAIELIRPVPALDEVLAHVKSAQMRDFSKINPALGQLNVDWVTDTGTVEVHNISRSSVAINPNSGLLLYGGGLGWGCELDWGKGSQDYESFHGRTIARRLKVGSPEVTATLVTLEDLRDVPAGFFDATSQAGDPQALRTILIDETSLRKNLLPAEASAWPPLQDGPLQGNVTTTVVVDRGGKVRETESMVSENSAINTAGRQRIFAMRFQPFLQDGIPVQVVSQITVPFKTIRPAGMETFDSARNYFDHGKKVSMLGSASPSSYILTADFMARGHDGNAGAGKYEDTWIDDSHWRREASFSKSRYLRTRNGDKRYELAEGPDVGLLRFVFKTVEPIPATDTFVESDWRIKRENVNGVDAIRVLAGYESPEGKLDPEQARGYWFDNSGLLLKTYLSGMETVWSHFEDFTSLKVARQIDVLRDGKLAARVSITGIAPAGTVTEGDFVLKGHEWQRAFTAEER